MAILGQNWSFLGPTRDIFIGAKRSQMTAPDMKYNVQPSLINVQLIWSSWNHLWPICHIEIAILAIWQFQANIGRFWRFGNLGMVDLDPKLKNDCSWKTSIFSVEKPCLRYLSKTLFQWKDSRISTNAKTCVDLHQPVSEFSPSPM